MQPGDYWKDNKGNWWLWPPTGNLGVLCPGHKVTEHEDGTISVWPSIVDTTSYFHGWLIKGKWKTNYHGP